MEQKFTQPKTPEQLSENIVETVKKNNFTKEQIEILISKLKTLIPSENMETTKDALEVKKEEKLNQLGLPEYWSRDRSIQGLEYLRKQLEHHSLGIEVPVDLLKHIFNITSKEYIKYRGQKSPSYTSRVNTDFSSELEHLKMNSVEKLVHFKKRWPEGLKIMGTNKHMKWEKILDYELWAMGNHDQTLYTLQRRGGLSSYELMNIIFGIKTDEVQKIPEEKRMEWFKDNDMLAE